MAISQEGRQIQPIYRPSTSGPIVVYAGDLLVMVDGADRAVPGQLELRLSPRSTFHAHVTGADPWLEGAAWNEHDPPVTLPQEADLTPPRDVGLPMQPDTGGWVDWSISLNHLIAGELAKVERLVLHLTGELTNHPLPRIDLAHAVQGQLKFTLPAWQLALVVVEDDPTAQNFSYVVEATPTTRPIEATAVGTLRRRLFAILSLVAGREVGVGPAAGLDATDQVRWAEWGAPRQRPGKPGVRWCPPHLVVDVVPRLADGFTLLDNDPGLDLVVDRAITYMLVANSSEPLDVRIPLACSGLELLGWAVLQRHQGMSRRALKSLRASEVARRLLAWAGIPIELPDGFDALTARQARVGESAWGGPEVAFNVRNSLVHPTTRLDAPAWPSPAELLETWQLTTWYLELAIVRLLGYQGGYWSRLRLGRGEWDTEPVPWTT